MSTTYTLEASATGHGAPTLRTNDDCWFDPAYGLACLAAGRIPSSQPDKTTEADWKYSYVVLERKRRGALWREVQTFKACGQCCQASAEDFVERAGINLQWPLRKLENGEQWRQMQVRQHLREVQSKRVRH